jgi:hypothetical protein
MKLVGGSFSLNLAHFCFRAYDRKGKQLKIKKVLAKNKRHLKSFRFPRYTKKINTFFNGKKIQTYQFRKPLRKKRGFGVSSIRRIISKRGIEKEKLDTLIQWFEKRGVKWAEIGSGQIPQKTYAKNFVFVWDSADYKKTYDYWKFWFAIAGKGSSEKATKNKQVFKREVHDGLEYWNIAFSVMKNVKGKRRGNVAAREYAKTHLKDAVGLYVTAHNSRYYSGKVFTQWSEKFVFLGVEGFNEK